MRELIERMQAEADLIHDNGITRKLPRHRVAALLREAAAALEAAMDGLRYAALVWVLSDEIEQSPETVDSAVRRMIRGGAEFRRTGHRAFPAIDQASDVPRPGRRLG